MAKADVDGSFVPGSEEGGIRVVIRDDKGEVLLTAWSYISKGSDAEEIEALACREGLKLAVEWCKQRLILESDCRSLVETMKKWERNRSQLGFILEEVLELADQLPEWKIAHTRRERNGVAYELA